MLMGPVFRAELLRTARQRRCYLLRFLYGLLLLLIVWTGYEEMRSIDPVVNLRDIARYAEQMFVSFAIVQLVTLLVLVPAVFGGAVADEKQRKTLHYLMASQLSGGEIILDKVLGRSAHLALFVGIGLPVVSLLGLFGGISVDSIAVAYIGTFSTVSFAIGLTVLVSTLARRVRDAVLNAYLLILMWLFVPPVVFFIGRGVLPGAYAWIAPVNNWLSGTSPVGLLVRSRTRGTWGGVSSMIDEFFWAVGGQLALSAIFLLLAIWRLRPTFRRQEETPIRRTWFRVKEGRRRSRWFSCPPCGDDPIQWKERYFAPVDRFTRLVLLPAIIFITLVLALMTEFEGDFDRVLTGLWSYGFGVRRYLPQHFAWAVQIDVAWYVAFWLLAVAGAAASSVTMEREKDTWVSLTATPLTGREILRGKVLGAIWHQRGFAPVLLFLWTLALITGAAHPVGVGLSIAWVGLLTWLVATVGVYASLRYSSTSRALAMTIVGLACLNGYPIILFLWFMGNVGWDSSYSLLGGMPSISAWSMISPERFEQWWVVVKTRGITDAITWILGGIGLTVLFIYVGTASALTWRILRDFDRWLDRPPLTSKPSTGPVPARHLEEVTTR